MDLRCRSGSVGGLKVADCGFDFGICIAGIDFDILAMALYRIRLFASDVSFRYIGNDAESKSGPHMRRKAVRNGIPF